MLERGERHCLPEGPSLYDPEISPSLFLQMFFRDDISV